MVSTHNTVDRKLHLLLAAGFLSLDYELVAADAGGGHGDRGQKYWYGEEGV